MEKEKDRIKAVVVVVARNHEAGKTCVQWRDVECRELEAGFVCEEKLIARQVVESLIEVSG